MQYVTDSKLILLSFAYATSKNGTYNSNLSFSLNNILTQDKNILYTQVNVVYAQDVRCISLLNLTMCPTMIFAYGCSPAARPGHFGRRRKR